jgi:hypothetical protein
VEELRRVEAYSTVVALDVLAKEEIIPVACLLEDWRTTIYSPLRMPKLVESPPSLRGMLEYYL